ncbi:MAG: polysaccharide biosynthesis tyrosine autokinase, partial [Nitrospira sp.]
MSEQPQFDGPVPQADDEESPLEEFLRTLRRRIWVIAGVALCGAAAAGAWSFKQRPIYESTVSVLVDREGPGVMERDQVYLSDTSPEFLQTHFELLRNEEVIRRAVEKLNLADRREYQANNQPAGGEAGAQLARAFAEHITVKPVRGSRIVHVTVEAEDPEFAAQAANTVAAVYIDFVLEMRAGIKEKAGQWFSSHLNELRKKVEESEQALYVFRTKYGLLDVRERQPVMAQRLVELNSELMKAEMKHAEAQTRHQQIARILQEKDQGQGINWSNLDTTTEVLSSPLIQNLRTEEIRASGRLAQLTERYKPLHPKIAQAESELQELRNKIRLEVKKIYSSIKQEYDTAVARTGVIKEALNAHKQESAELEQHEIEYDMLHRETESNRQLYETFLKQMKETDLTAGMLTSSISVVAQATPSTIPVKPRKGMNIFMGLMVGILTGMGVAFVQNQRDRSLKGPQDVKRYLPSRSLHGMIPLLDAKDVWDHHMAAAENYRMVRTSVLLSIPDRCVTALLVTSPGVGEGKTTLAINLGMVMAQLENMRVILIDADVRRPMLQRAFFDDGERRKGLAHFLSGKAGFEEIVHATKIPNLWVVPHGRIPHNPAELLHSGRMAALLARCLREGYRVIVDAPPALCVTDPMILASQVDGVLFAV